MWDYKNWIQSLLRSISMIFAKVKDAHFNVIFHITLIQSTISELYGNGFYFMKLWMENYKKVVDLLENWTNGVTLTRSEFYYNLINWLRTEMAAWSQLVNDWPIIAMCHCHMWAVPGASCKKELITGIFGVFFRVESLNTNNTRIWNMIYHT